MTADLADSEPAPPSYREILRFYYPLALSWLFMAMEAPITTAITSRSSEPRVQTAGLLLMMGMALFIESPVIDLLATSTTLNKSRRDFLVIRRFALWLMALCTVAHVGFCVTPLYGWITLDVLGIPAPVAEATRIPMLVMAPWSAAIGWRRFLQGLLIRNGRTRLIGVGTAIRVGTIAGTGFGLAYGTDWSGLTVAAAALGISVTAEAVYIHFAAMETLRERYGDGSDETLSSGVDLPKLLRFHLPLTATTLVFMTSLPVVGAALARTPNAVLAMAAWHAATSIIFLHRTVVFALPEPIIALYRGPKSAQKLSRFCLMVGLAASASMPILALLHLDRFVLGTLYDAPPDVTAEASFAYILCMSLPFIGAVQSYLRGMLTAHHLTVARLGAILVYTAVLISFLALGVSLKWPGVWVAAAATTGAALAEVGVLTYSWLRAKRIGFAVSVG